VTVTNYPAGELPYKGTDHLKIVKKGLVEMAEVNGGFVYGEMPLMTLPDLPYMALTRDDMKKYRDVVLPPIYAGLRKEGVEPLTWIFYGPRQIVSRKPTAGLQDMKGQKVRTSGGLQDEYIKLWGGVPTFVVWAEVYPAAQRGIVDAIMTATLAIQQSKVYEVCPNFFKIDGPVTYGFICINQDAWNAVSKKNQEIIRKVVNDFGRVWEEKVGFELDDVAFKEMLDRKQIKAVHELSTQEKIKTQKELIPVLREYVKKNVQPDGPAIFEKVLKALNLG
jgi:TRAP-type C4-dicarboxylate transport system substrate-binding protein